MIREAECADVDAIVQMATDFLGATRYGTLLTHRPSAMRSFAERLIAMEDGGILIALDGADPIGLLAMWIYLHPMSGDRIASELVWWVDPNRRGVGVKLLKRFEEWARVRQADILQMVAPSERVGAFFQAMHYEAVEVMYQRRVSA